ncbi:MAG: hypothetical protein LBL13_09645 [Bacteroidales bacterium]|jgi:hypothetical protein|nr:hypothetical protein [Bacteroidales bacterium]
MKIIILCLFFTSCQRCKEDETFKKEFLNCLQVVEKIQIEGYFLPRQEDFECRAVSIECLAAIAGYEGYVDKSTDHHYFYQCADSVDVDLRIWRDWYENNKCTFTIQMADSLIKKQDSNLHWPISADSLVNDDKYIYGQW